MKTVIEMAREANIEWDLIDKDEGQVWYITKAGLERFAELVRADERNRTWTQDHWTEYEHSIVAAERNSWPAEMEAMERQVNILTDALAEARRTP